MWAEPEDKIMRRSATRVRGERLLHTCTLFSLSFLVRTSTSSIITAADNGLRFEVDEVRSRHTFGEIIFLNREPRNGKCIFGSGGPR